MSLASAPLALCGSNENKQAMNILHPPTQNINGLEEYGPKMFRKFSLPVRDELCTFKYPSSAIPKDVFPSKTLVPHVIRSYITSQQQKRQMMMMKMMWGWGIPWRHHSYRISAQGGEENDKAKAQIVCISPKCRCPHCLLIPHLTNDHKKPSMSCCLGPLCTEGVDIPGTIWQHKNKQFGSRDRHKSDSRAIIIYADQPRGRGVCPVPRFHILSIH